MIRRHQSRSSASGSRVGIALAVAVAFVLAALYFHVSSSATNRNSRLYSVPVGVDQSYDTGKQVGSLVNRVGDAAERLRGRPEGETDSDDDATLAGAPPAASPCPVAAIAAPAPSCPACAQTGTAQCPICQPCLSCPTCPSASAGAAGGASAGVPGAPVGTGDAKELISLRRTVVVRDDQIRRLRRALEIEKFNREVLQKAIRENAGKLGCAATCAKLAQLDTLAAGYNRALAGLLNDTEAVAVSTHATEAHTPPQSLMALLLGQDGRGGGAGAAPGGAGAAPAAGAAAQPRATSSADEGVPGALLPLRGAGNSAGSAGAAAPAPGTTTSTDGSSTGGGRGDASTSAGALAPANTGTTAPQEVPTAVDMATAVLHRLWFPLRGAGNPVRTAWTHGGLDWHNLVPGWLEKTDPAWSAEVVTALKRERREAAKAGLLDLLQGFTPVRRQQHQQLLQLHHTALQLEPQQRILDFARQAMLADALGTPARRVSATTGSSAAGSAAGRAGGADAGLVHFLSQRPDVVAAAAGALDVDADDVSAYYAPEGDHGPLAKFAACSRVRDPCLVHGSVRACVDDELCGWCGATGVCVSRLEPWWPEKAAGKRVPVCAQPLHVTAASVPSAHEASGKSVYQLRPRSDNNDVELKAVPPSQCDVVVTRRRPVSLGISGNSKMSYHFTTETLPGWFRTLSSSDGLHHLTAHVWVPAGSFTEFLFWLHPFTDSCPRRIHTLEEAVAAPAEKGDTKAEGDDAAQPPVICYADREGPHVADVTLDGADDNARLTPEAAFGLPEPALATFDPLTGEVGAATLTLEPVAVAIAKGMRLGLRGMANVAKAAVGSLPRAAGLLMEHPGLSQQLMAAGMQPEALVRQAASAVRAVEKGGASFAAFVAQSLGLGHVAPSSARPVVTIISRRNKRFILNEADIVRAVLALGGEPVIASLETMPLYEQVRLFRRTSVLVGMHGSGLINSWGMTRGAALLQILPYGLKGGAAFFKGPAEGAGVSYHEYAVAERSHNGTIFHPHFLDSSYAGKMDAILSQGSDCCGQATYFTFWINQDVRVDAAGFSDVLQQALDAAARNIEPQRA